MNCDKYQNTLPYPESKNFTIKYWYKNGARIALQRYGGPIECIEGFKPADLPTATLENAIQNAEFTAARSAYYEETARLKEQFKNDLFKDLGIENNMKRELLFAKAWDNAHSNGFNSVYNEACDLVDLIL